MLRRAARGAGAGARGFAARRGLLIGFVVLSGAYFLMNHVFYAQGAVGVIIGGIFWFGEKVNAVQIGFMALMRGRAEAADEIFAVLMGEDVESRRSFIQRNAKDVRFLDI